MSAQEQTENSGNSDPRTQSTRSNPKEWSWRFWFTLPLYPYGKRRTLRQEVVKDTIWTFDQPHGILYTIVPIRMTIVKLAAGGLLVYAPVAPTKECIRLVNELVAQHGDLKYIILPTSSGLEHKVFVGPFARCFSQAQVFVAPHQWSFPLNLPLGWLGFPAKRTQQLPTDSSKAPFANEFDYAVLDIDLGRGSFVEVALLHKASRTLLVTDSIVSIPEKPPAIVQLDPYALLFHAREQACEPTEDNEANRNKGWQRIALFALYFRPSVVETMGLGKAIQDAANAPDRSSRAYFGLFPFRWQSNWQQSFQALRQGGHPLVAPILQVLILPQAPHLVLQWVDRVASWEFDQIIPCHFDAPVTTSPDQFRQAFAFLDSEIPARQTRDETRSLIEQDYDFIRQIEANLIRYGIASPAQT